nr:hypothetical protein BN993_02277 [Virgibacillus halodenitrificans]
MKKVVVILGSGRSGTSLLMNLASMSGVRVSKDLIGPNENNKKGAFEDEAILKISRRILRRFNRNGSALSFLPLPEDWMSDDVVIQEFEAIKKHVENETKKNQYWGFKEPVTAKLLPLWKRLFSELHLDPVYLVSLRHPSVVADSFQRAYGVPEFIANLIWLSRYTDAIIHTNGYFHAYDYDEWFNDAEVSLARLLEDLDVEFSKKTVELCKSVIDENLKTADKHYDKCNQAVRLYEGILEFSKGELCRESLVSLALESQEYLSTFDFITFPVDFLGRKSNDLLSKLNSEREVSSQLRSELRQLEDKNKGLTSKLNDVELKFSNPISYTIKKREITFDSRWEVVAGVASFKAREAVFKESIESVKDQFDHIYVYLNDYDSTPDFLLHDKFTVFHGVDYTDLSANGKVFSLGDIGSCYFFTLDDDIAYPGNYVERMVESIKKYNNKVGVCVHGSVLPKWPQWYFERYALYPFQSSLSSDKFVNLIGSGTFAFHTDFLKVEFSDFLPSIMVDLQFSISAKNQNIPLVSISRPKFWLKALAQGEGLYQSFLFKKTVHTEKVIENAPWGFEVYSDIVGNELKEIVDLPEEKIIDNNLDKEFLVALKSGGCPQDWSESSLYRSKIVEREFVKRPMQTFKNNQRRISQLETKLEKTHDSNMVLKKRAEEYRSKISNLRARVAQQQENFDKIRYSKSYRLTRVFIQAVKKPIWNMFLMPYRVLVIIFS